MDDTIKLLFILAVIVVSLVGTAIKKASEKRERERIEEKRRAAGGQKPPAQRRRPIEYRPIIATMPEYTPPPKKEPQYDEETIAEAVAEQYRQAAQTAPPEAALEPTAASYDVQYEGDSAVGEVGQTALVTKEIEALEKAAETHARRRRRTKISRLMRKGSPLKHAIILSEIINPPPFLRD
jgi:hypothetical protein